MNHCTMCMAKERGQHRLIGTELLCPACVEKRKDQALEKLKAAVNEYDAFADAVIRANRKKGRG